ncbi:HAMP domain-containing sensor histidine kinase [Marinifilum fragile]|uniref:sensor histidine kinase n=1 Tax=Marinifilum fragile TaxID=570161 RepID=UPI002AA61B38|nr:HAMP domain-containing sensor histidine kinase [Marinifilum fragile]
MKDDMELHNINEEPSELLLIKTIAHDLSSPIRTILGYISLLENNGSNLDDKELQKIYKTINHLATNAINQTEMLTKFNYDIIKFIQSDIDFNFPALINNLLSEFEFRIQDKLIRVKKQINLSDGKVRANEYSLSIIIRNLLDNAVKFSPACSEIIVSVEEKDQIIKLSIFNLFDKQNLADQENKSIKSKQVGGANGLGLGLIYCKQIASITNIILKFESIGKNGFLASVFFKDGRK